MNLLPSRATLPAGPLACAGSPAQPDRSLPVQATFHGARRRLPEQKLGQRATLAGVDNVALVQQLLDDALLLRRLKLARWPRARPRCGRDPAGRKKSRGSWSRDAPGSDPNRLRVPSGNPLPRSPHCRRCSALSLR